MECSEQVSVLSLTLSVEGGSEEIVDVVTSPTLFRPPRRTEGCLRLLGTVLIDSGEVSGVGCPTPPQFADCPSSSVAGWVAGSEESVLDSYSNELVISGFS